MANSDPWLGINWKVYAVQGPGGDYLKPDGKQGSFTLTAVQDPASGKAAYYTVSFAAGEMPSCWQGLLLYPRGSVQVAPPTPLLQPWTPSGDAPWLAAANAVRQGLNDATARLEGDLNAGANPAALTLVCVPKATTAGTPLLVQKLVPVTAPGKVQPMDDPTGGGHGDN
jgi:hypothetical protein